MPRTSVPSLLRKQVNKLRFRYRYKAPVPMDLAGIDELRNDAFPQGASDCWLDRADAKEEIERRLRLGRMTQVQAKACRSWVDNGYLVLSGLIARRSPPRAGCL